MAAEILLRCGNSLPFHWHPMCQIWLLVGVRMVINMARVSVGPLVVAMMADFEYSMEERGDILSAFSAGYALTQIAGGLVAEHSGSVPVLSMSLLSACIGMLLLPTAAGHGVNALWCLLFVAGTLQGPVFAAMQVSFSRWASGSLASYASMLANAGTTMGSVVGLGVTPFLITSFGWRTASHYFGVSCALLTIGFMLFAHSSPQQQHTVINVSSSSSSSSSSIPDEFSPQEEDATATKPVLVESIGGKIQSSLPVLVRIPVLAIFVAHTGSNFLRNFYMSWMPTYCSEVLAMPSTLAGACLIIPEIAAVVCGMMGAKLSRSLQERGTLSVLSCMKLFTLVGTFGTVVALISMRRMMQVPTVVVCLSVIQVFAAISNSGYSANYSVVTKHHSGLISGVGNTIASLGSYYAPKVASGILADETLAPNDRWPYVFLVVAAINAIASLFYIVSSSADPVDVNQFRKDK